LTKVVRETRDRSPIGPVDEGAASGQESEVMALLVELRTASRRGTEAAGSERLGPEFQRYLGAFYNLPPELQVPAISGLVESARREEAGDLAGAAAACDAALEACPDFPPLLERLARLECELGRRERAEQWYGRLLSELDRLDLWPEALDLCRRLQDLGVRDMELLERCARRLEAANDLETAARYWSLRASSLLSEGREEDALSELDRAIMLQPGNAGYRLELGLVYERLGEMDRAALAFEQAEQLVGDDPLTLLGVLLIRARISRPEETALARLMDLLEAHPEARPAAQRRCARAVAESPYNPHLCYLEGLLLAQDGQITQAIAALRIAVDRYLVQADEASELVVRQALRQLDPRDEENARRIAEMHFERGEVRQAMQTLNALAKASRR
jgi:tetratricopeptide (TPR) repeat protein